MNLPDNKVLVHFPSIPLLFSRPRPNLWNLHSGEGLFPRRRSNDVSVWPDAEDIRGDNSDISHGGSRCCFGASLVFIFLRPLSLFPVLSALPSINWLVGN